VAKPDSLLLKKCPGSKNSPVLFIYWLAGEKDNVEPLHDSLKVLGLNEITIEKIYYWRRDKIAKNGIGMTFQPLSMAY
jgi:NADPH-dependent ferric siderophore reductase